MRFGITSVSAIALGSLRSARKIRIANESDAVNFAIMPRASRQEIGNLLRPARLAFHLISANYCVPIVIDRASPRLESNVRFGRIA